MFFSDKTWVMWIEVIAGTAFGMLIVAACSRNFGQITLAGVQHWLLLGAVVLASICLIAVPCIAFLKTGWKQRLDKFKNQIRNGAIKVYLKQFWERRLDDMPAARDNSAAAENLFNDIYVAQYGRRAFIPPVILLLGVTLLSSILVVQTGIDTCVAGQCVGGPAITGRFAPLGDIMLPRASAVAIGVHIYSLSGMRFGSLGSAF